MNEVINKFLLAGDKFMPYNTCGPFTKNKEWMDNFKETGDSKYIYHNELDYTCFQYDMA